jgi:hypothetical protein
MVTLNQIERDMLAKGEASMRSDYTGVLFTLKAPGFYEVQAQDKRTGVAVTGSLSFDFMQGAMALCLDTKIETPLKRVLGDVGALAQAVANGPVRFDDTPPKR